MKTLRDNDLLGISGGARGRHGGSPWIIVGVVDGVYELFNTKSGNTRFTTHLGGRKGRVRPAV